MDGKFSTSISMFIKRFSFNLEFLIYFYSVRTITVTITSTINFSLMKKIRIGYRIYRISTVISKYYKI
jgi:hypothetical protein